MRQSKHAFLCVALMLLAAGCGPKRSGDIGQHFERVDDDAPSLSKAHLECCDTISANGLVAAIGVLTESDAFGYGKYVACMKRLGWERLPPLQQAASRNRTSQLKRLLNDGADINSKSATGGTALIWAARFCQVAATTLLIEYGADVNITGNNGATALSHAAGNGYVAVVEILLDNGADINVQTDKGLTPLYLAAFRGERDVVQMLLDRGADKHIKSNKGITPFQIAQKYGHKRITALLR